ncbi:salicylate hydroxylase [Xanthomonas arboricola]|uniref:FAD-dependent monooxygenase n=1 Tax=Xanthomonas arboricola TaxID=56448 RepID=UPI00061A2DC2|nr:FAD-dependent monooxygenase [Xanthomonas arboricola]AKC81511.1 salicylate hydroxylase [Xanthomonas arboricola]
MNDSADVVIVGGSLAGLTLALACATRGVAVRVIERTAGHVQGGDSLSIDLSLVARTVGYDPRQAPILPVVPAYRELTTWPALYTWLRDKAIATPLIELEEGQSISSVEQSHGAVTLTLGSGATLSCNAVIGADGYRSLVRQAINPEMPHARYAGYLVWRGLVEERALAGPVDWPSNGGLWIEFKGGHRLVAAVLPGRDGSVIPGQRQVTFAWFDAHRQALLRSTGCLTGDNKVVGTLGRGTIDEATKAELLALVRLIWPLLWQEAVAIGIRTEGILSGAPIAEYRPNKLASGAIAIIGDAAHVVSPMTGRGYLTGVEDAALLAQLLATRGSAETYEAVFAQYQAQRLPFVQGLVTHSSRLSAQYSDYAQGWAPITL